MPQASQLHFLHNFVLHHPALFHKKLWVDPPIFDDILDQIINHPIFQNQSNNKQSPISIQLAVFLFHAGHYGNACTPEDVTQWAGVSIRTVVNFTHHVMAALLDQHDKFIFLPHAHSEEIHQACAFTESWTAHAWRKGTFSADGSTINLYVWLGMFGDSFYDWKSQFSLNCQVGLIL
ncbi:hypothetical protein M404DRAFT_149397 [Pisolithus tinctorius Marx 270]|uniref:DDE Tnp4 domain-containing protein n=1 Tax=Pisolithus tinctorius Marx 270 TaxID=870435 RepID=A0A0C3P2I9_PISTI|nr:hypothetical protein M404DRAFT_149397 [Pisolithus tinctorius Marx 270]